MMFRRDGIPVYDRGGMRLDLALSDPERRGGHKWEYRDTFTPEFGREQVYQFGVMFPDDFQPFEDRFLISQFKNLEDFGHSPSVSLQVLGEQFFFKFRPVDVPGGYDDRIRHVGYTDIVRNRWYDFTLTVVWNNEVKNHSGSPRFKAECNGNVLVDDKDVPNSYVVADRGPALHVGPYIWDWAQRPMAPKTQTIYVRF